MEAFDHYEGPINRLPEKQKSSKLLKRQDDIIPIVIPGKYDFLMSLLSAAALGCAVGIVIGAVMMFELLGVWVPK